MINLELENHEVELGQSLKGQFIWRSPSVKKAIAVIISTGWSTRGKGICDRVTVGKQIFGDVEPNEIYGFAIDLSLNAPNSYEGKLIQIMWEVKMTAYNHGFLGKFGNQTQEYFAALKVFPRYYRMQS
jgi:hypothetical protein